MEEDDIIVRRYIDKDYADITKAGYPFSSYLTPKLNDRLKSLINREGIKNILFKKILVKNLLLNQEEIILVAYSKKARKAVGVITLRKITNNLWGVWNIFVSPLSRGKRIASLLYQKSFESLKERKIKKVVGVVSLDNVASIKSIQRDWQGFLSTRILRCEKKSQIDEDKIPNKIRIRKPLDEKRNIFEIFRSCVGEQWCRILEIDKNNFLDRVFGPSYFEPISQKFLTRLVMKKDVFIAEYKGKIEGYAISTRGLTFHVYHALILFVPVSDNFTDVCRGLLIKALNPLMCNRKSKFDFIYIGNVEVESYLRKLGFGVKQSLVPYKYL